jgi:hypothetical protein
MEMRIKMQLFPNLHIKFAYYKYQFLGSFPNPLSEFQKFLFDKIKICGVLHFGIFMHGIWFKIIQEEGYLDEI